MIALNLRQKMIGCFCLNFLVYLLVGLSFVKDFDLFTDDITLLMHTGKLSNVCLEIRRYEKNYFIHHDHENFETALTYIKEASEAVPKIIDDLKIMPHPPHLKDFFTTLSSYEENFHQYRELCGATGSIPDESKECEVRDNVRKLGQDLVTITENLSMFAQEKMDTFISQFKVRLLRAVVFLTLMSIFTILAIYMAVAKPLKRVENAAIDIANGTFSQIQVDNKKGEVRSVLRAFNSMVQELEEKQEQLFQAKKLSSIGTLASGTAHQINNPLNNISTSCQLAQSELEDKDFPFVMKMLETIEQETRRAGEIVRGLLEFSRTQTFTLQPNSLYDVVNRVQQLVASEAPAGVTLTANIPRNIVVMVDTQKIVEALLNLTINAIQAIPEPPGSVTISAEKDGERQNAIITVADTGVGIDKENMQKVFDPFFTTKDAKHGTGLGLAVVYGIIKKHNGSTRVVSEEGKGTRFIITLPLHHENENDIS